MCACGCSQLEGLSQVKGPDMHLRACTCSSVTSPFCRCSLQTRLLFVFSQGYSSSLKVTLATTGKNTQTKSIEPTVYLMRMWCLSGNTLTQWSPPPPQRHQGRDLEVLICFPTSRPLLAPPAWWVCCHRRGSGQEDMLFN